METKKSQKRKGEKAAEKKDSEKSPAGLLETLQRVQAEFENYKKRVEKEKAGFQKLACSEIIKELLPLLDNFDMALKNTSSHGEFASGIRMIRDQLLSILSGHGLSPIEAEGKKFNPYVHEALMQEESDREEGTIIEEFQKGYMLGDSVLRHSKVKVSSKKKGSAKEVQK